MSHAIDETTGRAAIAYKGATPWHGLGFRMEGNETLDQWRTRAGLDWSAERAPVRFQTFTTAEGGAVYSDLATVTGQDVLYRSDTKCALGIVGSGYKCVQPADVIDFYRDLAASHGLEMETAGALKGGRVIWALASTGESFQAKRGDQVNGFVLMATSFDGSQATTLRHTSVRVVCANTMAMAYGQAAALVKVSHRSLFDADAAKIQLGFEGQLATFAEQAQALAARKVTVEESIAFFLSVYHGMTAAEVVKAQAEKTTDKTIARLARHFVEAPGAELAGQTAWGLLNAVTFDLDHVLGRSQDSRLASSWFAEGAKRKADAFAQALALV